MTSGVWDYFSQKIVDGKKEKDSATCNICKKTYKTGGGTSSLISHLQRLHPFEHLKLKKKTVIHSACRIEREEKSKETANAEETADATKQQSISQMFQNQQKYGKNDQYQKKITNLIVDHVIENMQPFSLVNSKSFRNLVGYLNPRYTMPDRKTLSKDIIPKRYADVS